MRNKIEKIINNNKVIAGISLLIAIVLWLTISVTVSPIEQKVVTGVPVVIATDNTNLKQLDLKLYNNKDFFVDVTVSGKKYEIANITKDDIKIEADTKFVDSTGIKTLSLISSIDNSDIEIQSLSQNYVNVLFDKEITKDFTLETKIDKNANKLLPDKCFLGTVILSQNTVSVTGPQSEVSTITGVTANIKFDKKLDKSTTVTPTIKIVGPEKYIFSTVKDLQTSNIVANVPVMKKVTLPTTVSFANVPEGFDENTLKYEISEKKVTASIQVEDLDTIKAISVGTINYEEISEYFTSFFFPTKDCEYKVDSKYQNFYVSIDLSDYSEKSFEISSNNITITNNDKLEVVPDQKIKIRVNGKPADLEKINAGKIYAEINAKDMAIPNVKKGEVTTIKVPLMIKGKNNIWAYNKYEILVKVK